MPRSLEARFKERNFLPALKPRYWQARKTVFCRRLVDDEHESVPLVAYGWDAPDRTEFVTREAIADVGASKNKAHKYALRNLARRAKKVKWTKERYPVGRKKVAVAMVEGDEFTASFVLVPEFLELAHDLLDCETLIVGIPNRFSLWACDASLAPLMVSFAEAQFEAAEEEELEPVTSALILSEDGKLAGIVVADTKPKRKPKKERASKTKERSKRKRDEESGEGRASRKKERSKRKRDEESDEGRSSRKKERSKRKRDEESGEGRSSRKKERPKRKRDEESGEGRSSKTKERSSKTKERASKPKERSKKRRAEPDDSGSDSGSDAAALAAHEEAESEKPQRKRSSPKKAKKAGAKSKKGPAPRKKRRF